LSKQPEQNYTAVAKERNRFHEPIRSQSFKHHQFCTSRRSSCPMANSAAKTRESLFRRGRRHLYKILVYGGVPGVALLLACSYFIQAVFLTPHLNCVIYSPVQDPDGSGSKIQIVVIRNVSRKSADSLEVSIRHLQLSSLDYQIDGTRKTTSVSRSPTSLDFSLNTLPPYGYILVTLSTDDKPVGRGDVTVSFHDETIKPTSIDWETGQ
jgi:hypothetical protein